MKKLIVPILLMASAYAMAAPVTATATITTAEQTAAKHGKNVLLIFHASWCGWCHKLDKYLENPQIKPIVDKNYVVIHIDVMESKDKKDLETPGWESIADQYNASKQGLPYYLVLDSHGKTLITSGNPGNIGYPSKPEEVAYFMKMLHQTATHMAGADADEMEAVLKANP